MVIVSARRTPIGRFLGSLRDHTAPELGMVAARAALEGAPRNLSNLRVVLGCARQAGTGPNPARQVALGAGLGHETVAATLNMACASGMESIATGARLLTLGEVDWVLAGGMESMSRVPFLADRFRTGYRLGHAELADGMYKDGFFCPLAEQVMGETAETLAKQYRIPRAEQDELARQSQEKAAHAWATHAFGGELASVPPKNKKGDAFERDEHLRPGTTLADLAKLPTVFERDGTVTAGNSSGITDGAAALLVTRASVAKAAGVTPLARLVGYAVAGVDPKVMGIGPVPAVRSLLERLGMTLGDMDLIEVNEAFAAQVLAVERELRFDRTRLNVNGGAIALGHPIGATGARIVVTLLHEMIRRDVGRGLATLCVSGGMGHAMVIERD
ncbi:MAG: thiolase family protein [Phycisphaerales bacterium]|nr:thiolase family protein [Phycisphaerales bacterium]